MPVVVTGAGGIAGRAVLRRLAPRGGELRALVGRISEVPAVREIVPKCAAPDLEDTEEVALMLHDTHTVVHLHPEPDLPEAALNREVVRTTEWIVEAAQTAKVRRFVLLSCTGARPDALNAYQTAAAAAEEALAASSIPEQVVVRAGATYGPGGLWTDVWKLMSRPLVAVVPGSGAQVLGPVAVDDVAAALAAADDRGTALSGTFELEGPDRVNLDYVVDIVSKRQRRKLHVSPRRASALLITGHRQISVVAMDLLSRDWLSEPPSAAKEFGLELVPFEDGLARG
jgi:uncharacterized protein YbjT (DUF2867 family)